ncbi:unnamed protein product [Soboliphyme baturini]|uniref:Uncharacterized protein n=1 Tax=Soboliphyme baturini TaxID=241478 RepID=A0A183J8U3_9BILA|nr:unnamed protein product [Soboliphyme baturini]
MTNRLTALLRHSIATLSLNKTDRPRKSLSDDHLTTAEDHERDRSDSLDTAPTSKGFLTNEGENFPLRRPAVDKERTKYSRGGQHLYPVG